MNAKIIRKMLHYAVLIAAAIVIAAPSVWAVLASLRPPGDSFASGNVFFGTGLSLANYAKAFSLAPFARYYMNTILQIGLILSMQLISSSLAAFAFARWRFPGDRLLFTVILLQMMIPAAALLVGQFQMVSSLGLYDSIPGIAIPFFGSAFGTFLLRQSFLEIPRDLTDAAEIDGCNWFLVLWHVYLPNSRSAITAFAVSSISWHWNDLLWPLIISQSETVRPVSAGLLRFTQLGEIGAQWGLLAAATVIVALPLFLLFILFRRQFVEGYLSSGLK